ncbi:hypothetical protein DPMN_129961 [Dreissena polymorpha]|uniref:Uncharacterized protein n=1 Tax=Dreissena polymorpha TaxID=45954 RepID=A0A9D4H5W6_DREPO|nr:hypothetical protein DPMN_129961 [Dreissena polymorpha]
MKCGAQTKITSYKREQFHKILFYNGKVYVGGNKYVTRFYTYLLIEQRVDICSENCDANVNKILLINSAANELVECSSGDKGLCKIRDLDSLPVERNSSYVVATGNKQVQQGLTVSAEKDEPSQSH